MRKVISALSILVLSFGLLSCQSKTEHGGEPTASQPSSPQGGSTNPSGEGPKGGEQGHGDSGSVGDAKSCGNYCLDSKEAHVFFLRLIDHMSGEKDEFDYVARVVLAARAVTETLHETRGVWLDEVTESERRYLLDRFFDENFFLRDPKTL